MAGPLLEFSKPVNAGTQTGRMTLYIIIGVFMLLLLVLLVKGNTRVKEKPEEPIKVQPVDNISIGTQKEHWFDSDKVKVDIVSERPNTAQSETAIIKRSVDESVLKLKQLELDQEHLFQEEQIKLRTKERLEAEALAYAAAKAPLTIKIDEMKRPQKDSPVLNMDAISQTVGNGIPLPPLQPQAEDPNQQDHKVAFLRSGVAEGEYLPNTKKKALSPYEIKAGTYIPAAMVTGINSDLPGSIVAQVTENVYDTVSGQFLLIPQGARLIGMYDSQVSFGQSRALVVWTRIIFPDGASINLERMAGVDISGYAGFKDQVNNHYLRIYGNALLLSLVGAGYDMLNKKQDVDSNDPGQAIAANVGQKLSDVTSDAIRKNSDTQPTITIRPGYKFKVMVMKDMILDDVTSGQ